MVFIKLYVESMADKETVLNWMINRIYEKGDLSMCDLIIEHGDKLKMNDEDVFGYWDVGWNILDLMKLHMAKNDFDNSEIPEPKYRYWKHYT